MAGKNLYIIAGCNGAGKTTASFTLLPELIACKEFVNADEIAKGISPFQPQEVAFEAGRIMLQRINGLLNSGASFAFETTLATRSHRNRILFAKENGYDTTLIFLWLENVNLALERVKTRVLEGGHNIDRETIIRRYHTGIRYLFDIYLPLADGALIFDNSSSKLQLIAQKTIDGDIIEHDAGSFQKLKATI